MHTDLFMLSIHRIVIRYCLELLKCVQHLERVCVRAILSNAISLHLETRAYISIHNAPQRPKLLQFSIRVFTLTCVDCMNEVLTMNAFARSLSLSQN